MVSSVNLLKVSSFANAVLERSCAQTWPTVPRRTNPQHGNSQLLPSVNGVQEVKER